MSDLLNLLIPHPSEALFQRGSVVIYELLGEEPEISQKYHASPIPIQLEVLGTPSKGVLSLHLLDKPYNGNLKKLERACNLLSASEEEKIKKMFALTEAMQEFNFDLDIPPKTLVYEFATADWHIKSISRYDGNFTDSGWRWEKDHRRFRKEGYDLGREFALAQKGYRAAQQAKTILEERLKDRNLFLSERDFYDHYCRALTSISDKEAMKRFVEFVSQLTLNKK